MLSAGQWDVRRDYLEFLRLKPLDVMPGTLAAICDHEVCKLVCKRDISQTKKQGNRNRLLNNIHWAADPPKHKPCSTYRLLLERDNVFPILYTGLPTWLSGKESACQAGNVGLIPGLGRSPGEGNSNPLQYPRLGNPTDRGAWRAKVHGVAKSQAQLSNWTTTILYTAWSPILYYLLAKWIVTKILL